MDVWHLDLWIAKNTGWAFWHKGGTGQAGVDGECVGSPHSGGEPGLGGRLSGRAEQALGCVGAVLPGLPALLGAEWLVARSYLAGVDGALWVTCTQVVGVDFSCVPAAAVAELGTDELDLGLLQVIAWFLSCEQRKE